MLSSLRTGHPKSCADRGQPVIDKAGKDSKSKGGIDAIVEFYTAADEIGRLETGLGRLEFMRTKEIVMRYLPKPLGPTAS